MLEQGQVSLKLVAQDLALWPKEPNTSANGASSLSDSSAGYLSCTRELFSSRRKALRLRVVSRAWDGHTLEDKKPPTRHRRFSLAILELTGQSRLQLDDAVWSALEPDLRLRRGRPTNSRKVLEGVLEVMVCGAKWEPAARLHGRSISVLTSPLSRWKKDGRWVRASVALRQAGFSAQLG